MAVPNSYLQQQARERYFRSRFRAQMAEITSMIAGTTTDLLRYDEVASKLKARQQVEQGLQVVPLDLIVGSVGRYRDFTRTFLPRAGVNLARWAHIDGVMNSLEGLPPIELFKMGEVYFVRDGNHRVSVARANRLRDIEAYVIEVKTAISLTIDDIKREQWRIKAEYVEFLDKTGLTQIRPNHSLAFTASGSASLLLQHIEVHRYLYNHQGTNVLGWTDAVASWYDTVYMPVVDTIRRFKVLEQFPGRTETDLYLRIAHHREELAARHQLAPLSPDVAVSTFAQTHGERLLARIVQRVIRDVRYGLGYTKVPQGMSLEEYQDARARRSAGEITLSQSAQALGSFIANPT